MKRILFAIFLTFSFSSFAQKLTLDDIYKTYKYYHTTFFDDAQIFGDSIYIQSFQFPFDLNDYTEIQGVPASATMLSDKKGTTFIYSDNLQSYRRYSTIGSYMKLDKTRDSTLIKPLFDEENIEIINPVFSPDGQKLCFVYNNNLYYTNFDGKYVQITNDGEDGKIRNGSPNMIYEEEFDLLTAYWWSPDSKKICFLKFDESEIQDRPLYTFGDLQNQGGEPHIQKYSFVGEKNAKVSTHIFMLETGFQKEIPEPVELHESDENGTYYNGDYITSVTWLNDNELLIAYMNSAHKQETIAHYTLGEKRPNPIIFNKKEDSYLNPSQIVSLENNSNFLIIDDSHANDRYAYIVDDENEAKTYFGPIKNFYGYYPSDSTIRYQTYGLTIKDRKVVSQQIYPPYKTYSLSDEIGHNKAKFSNDGKYILLNHSEIDIKEEYTSTMKICNGEIMPLWINITNTTIRDFSYDNIHLTPVEWITIPTENDSLFAYIIKPKLKKKQKCPVYVTTYGGPTGQVVMNAYNYETFWFQFLVQQGYAVVVVDTRGSEGRGLNFAQQTYLNLGEKESYDMHVVAEYLKQQPFVDGNRLAFQGWSFGGYLALLTASKYPEDYKAVIAIAPVADWRLYDNIYTEKYMSTPQGNPEGYDNSSVLNYLPDIQASILLAYGTADDNVRNSNEMMILRNCIDNEKDIRTLVFPNDDHNLSGRHSRIYLMRNMFNFLESKLK